MDDNLYDEFGNYIGPDVDADGGSAEEEDDDWLDNLDKARGDEDVDKMDVGTCRLSSLLDASDSTFQPKMKQKKIFFVSNTSIFCPCSFNLLFSVIKHRNSSLMNHGRQTGFSPKSQLFHHRSV